MACFPVLLNSCDLSFSKLLWDIVNTYCHPSHWTLMLHSGDFGSMGASAHTTVVLLDDRINRSALRSTSLFLSPFPHLAQFFTAILQWKIREIFLRTHASWIYNLPNFGDGTCSLEYPFYANISVSDKSQEERKRGLSAGHSAKWAPSLVPLSPQLCMVDLPIPSWGRDWVWGVRWFVQPTEAVWGWEARLEP